jgi:uncharacterized cupin superfamily protein
VRRFNLRSGDLEHESDRQGFRWRMTRLGGLLGSARIGASLYELAEGQRTFPYHFHHGVEEWLLVVDGEPSVRTPAGERRLEPGDLLCFAAGAEGAHSVRGPARVVIISANREPSISVYPDSDKLGTRPGAQAEEDTLNFRRADAVDYWDGE